MASSSLSLPARIGLLLLPLGFTLLLLEIGFRSAAYLGGNEGRLEDLEDDSETPPDGERVQLGRIHQIQLSANLRIVYEHKPNLRLVDGRGNEYTINRSGFRRPLYPIEKVFDRTRHHIEFRSAGGSDYPRNCTTPCAFHHLCGVYAGIVGCSAELPDGLRFAPGLRRGSPPLFLYEAGDRLVA